MLQTNNTGVRSKCLSHTGSAPAHGACNLPAHTARALGCSTAQAELFVRQRERPGLPSQEGMAGSQLGVYWWFLGRLFQEAGGQPRQMSRKDPRVPHTARRGA